MYAATLKSVFTDFGYAFFSLSGSEHYVKTKNNFALNDANYFKAVHRLKGYEGEGVEER